MTKLAVFVEGQTEQIFVQRLLLEIAGARNIAIDAVKGSGGAASPRNYSIVTATAINGHRYYAMIYDCSGDSRVASDIRDQYPTLVAQGYSMVLGLRDVYPQQAAKIPAIRAAMTPILPTGPAEVTVVLGIMEIEAWFVAEMTHFQRVDPLLTMAVVKATLGARGEDVPCEAIPHPTATLDSIYACVGRSYAKDRKKVSMLVSALDFNSVYLELGANVPSLQTLCTLIDQFLTK